MNLWKASSRIEVHQLRPVQRMADFEMLAGLAQTGVLEVAFGGGEPFVFKGFAELARRLWEETPLAVNVTTNGLALTPERLRRAADQGSLRLLLSICVQ